MCWEAVEAMRDLVLVGYTAFAVCIMLMGLVRSLIEELGTVGSMVGPIVVFYRDENIVTRFDRMSDENLVCAANL